MGEKGNGVADLFRRYNDLSKEIRDLEKERDLIKEQLQAKIPPNQAKAGVYHEVTESKSISYAKALPDLKSLIPKTKYPEVDIILTNHTKYYERHKLKVEK
jgi:hypothetical protein